MHYKQQPSQNTPQILSQLSNINYINLFTLIDQLISYSKKISFFSSAILILSYLFIFFKLETNIVMMFINIMSFHHTIASILLLLFIILPTARCFLDYDKSHTLSCLSVDSSLSFTEQTRMLWNVTVLHKFDIYLFAICDPIIIVIELAIIINFMKNKILLSRPGDIFFTIVVTDFFIVLHNLSAAIFALIVPPTSSPMPNSFIPFCISWSIIYSCMSIMEICCLFLFFIYILYAFRSTTLKKTSKWLKYPPFIVMAILSIGFSILCWFEEFLGLNSQGLCGVTMTRRGNYSTLSIPITGFVLDILFLIFGIYTWVFFKKHMPKTEGLRRKSYQMNKTIGIYFVGFTIISFIYTINDIVIFINCYMPKPVTGLTVMSTFDNIIQVLESIFIVCMVFRNSRFRRKFLKMLRRLFQKRNNTTLEKSQSIQLQHYFGDELQYGMDDRIIQLIQQQNRVDLLKIAEIITVVSGVKMSQKQYMNDLIVKSIKQIYFCQTITFKVSPKILKDYDVESGYLPRVGMLDSTVLLYYPRAFKRLLINDNLMNIQQSFNLLKNYQKMYNLVQGQGGKSGQFFFFTYDNRYVLKTINKYEFEFLSHNMQYFAQHYEQNPQSLLAKIYGLYTVSSEQLEKKIHLILMKNLIGRPKQRILRTYDIKGSKYDREVIKTQKSYKFNQLRKLTLKDTDFMKLEGKLHVEPTLIPQFREIIKKDTLFLKSLNLIDYSLLVVRLYDPTEISTEQPLKQQKQVERPTSNTDTIQNKQLLENLLKMIEETQQLNRSKTVTQASVEKKQESQTRIFNQFQRMHSTQAPYQFYHIGIIDYMQKWDLQKKGQKWWKTMTGKKDVSAQAPGLYQQRFMNFVEEITIFDNVDKASIFSQSGNRSSYAEQSPKLFQFTPPVEDSIKVNLLEPLETEKNPKL